jgi:glycosyltransferase involved in cell wall biosynthesis
MQIGLDHRTIKWGQGTGIHRYRDRLRQIVIGGLAEEKNIRLLGDRQTEADTAMNLIRADIYRKSQRKFRLTGALTQVDLGPDLDIFHWSHPLPMSAICRRNIYTIHDIIPITAPALSAIDPRRFTRLIKRLIATDACFTAVSRNVANDFIAWSGIAPDRVFCTYQWVPPIPEGTLVCDGLVQSGYFLMLGRLEPRKNIERMVTAWQQAKTGLPLVIAGPDGHWNSAKEKARLDLLLDNPNIIRLGWVSDEMTERLMANCRGLLMPSLAEGFGLPMVEAMAAGVPTLAARTAIAEEISGGAAVLVDPLNIEDMEIALGRLHFDEALRQSNIGLGRIVAERFSAANFTINLKTAYQHFW